MARRSRVLHVLKYYRPAFTGEGVFMERCTGYMQTAAPQVEHDLLVTSTPEPVVAPPACSTLRRVYYLSHQPLSGWRHELVLLWWCIRHLHRYGTVHIRTHADWYFLTYIYAKLIGCRLVLSATLDDSVPILINHYRRRLRPLVRWAFGLFDGFVSISPKLQRETVSCVPPERCHLVPCGIDFLPLNRARGQRVRAGLGIPANALVLIFVGGLCQRKDPLLLVRHLPELLRHNPDSWLLLVGPDLEPDYVSTIHAFVRDTAIADRVIFIGEVQDPHPYFDAADIMTFASHLEGFGTVVPEAMAHGLPVVVRHLPEVNDLFVRDGETGFFFTDDAGYLQALLLLAGDPALRQSIGARARDFVRETLDMAQVARRYLAIYGFPTDAPTPEAMEPAMEPAIDLAELGTSASILNPRLHRPAAVERLDRPYLLTIVDAEEEFDWTEPFSRSRIGVGSMLHQGPAQQILERFGAVPTYMVDYPVVTHDAGRAPLREMLRDGRCDIGTQLHPWVSPPFLEQVCNRNSYPGNLPVALELEKIRRLTEAIEDSLATRPRIYRAGRYGVGTRTADILQQLGYLADSSVMPGWDFTAQEGADFSCLSPQPFWLDDARGILEIPVSSAMVGKLSTLPESVRRAVLSRPSERIGLPSLTAHLNLLERIKLTPEGITIPEAKRLIRHMLAHGQKVFVVTYHTPSLVPGNTPYVRNQAELGRFLAWLEEIYGFFTDHVGGRCATWRELRETLQDAPEPAARLAEPGPMVPVA
jgi:glycosyltransferase involved in cell wall biosynthesis